VKIFPLFLCHPTGKRSVIAHLGKIRKKKRGTKKENKIERKILMNTIKTDI